MGNLRGTQSIADAAAHSVAQQIERLIDEQYALHQRLPPERQLCRDLAVSRQTLRRGLVILEDKGIIWRHVGKGTFIGATPASVASTPLQVAKCSSLHAMFEARDAIEPVLARLAAHRASRREIESMEKYCDRGESATSWTDYDRWDDLFHRSLADASGNVFLIGWLDALNSAKRLSRWHIARARIFDPDAVRRYSKDHKAILFYIRNKDAQRSEEAMRRHIVAISESVGPILSA
jgi:DNA-binding FadR family transcriptional regulator